MSVITGQELATYMGLTYATYSAQFTRAIESAEMAAAAEIGALNFVEVTDEEDTLKIKASRNVIELQKGIVTDVTEITIGGTAVDSTKIQSSYWLAAYEDGFKLGDIVVVTYSHGYASKSVMPGRLAEGILQIGAWMFSKSGPGPHIGPEKTSEKLGDWAASYKASDGEGDAIPVLARKLLAEFRRPPA